MRVHSVICFRSVVSESCVIVGLNPVCCRRVRPPYRREQGGSTLRGRGLANAAAPPYDQQVTTPLISRSSPRGGTTKRCDMARALTIGTLLALLAFVLWIAYDQWTMVSVDIPAWGWLAILAGGGFSLVVGVGLMALMYYSQRHGYDEQAHEIERDER